MVATGCAKAPLAPKRYAVPAAGQKQTVRQGAQSQADSCPSRLDRFRAKVPQRQASTALQVFVGVPLVVHKRYAALQMYRKSTPLRVRRDLQDRLVDCLGEVEQRLGADEHLGFSNRSVKAQRGAGTGSLRICRFGAMVGATVDLDSASRDCCKVV